MPRVKIPGAIPSNGTRGLPLSQSDILALDYIPASGKVPELLSDSCSDRRVFISGLTAGAVP